MWIFLLSSVGISVYRFFTIFQSADIAGIVIEKILPYRLFPICRLFVDIENVYIEIISIKYTIINLFLTINTLKLLSEIVNNTEWIRSAATLIWLSARNWCAAILFSLGQKKNIRTVAHVQHARVPYSQKETPGLN